MCFDNGILLLRFGMLWSEHGIQIYLLFRNLACESLVIVKIITFCSTMKMMTLEKILKMEAEE